MRFSIADGLSFEERFRNVHIEISNKTRQKIDKIVHR